MNDNTLKITGSVSIPEELDIEGEYTIGLTGNVQSKDKRSNNDGTFTVAHSLKLTGKCVIQDSHGKNTYGKTKGSQSQKFRSELRKIHQGDDFESFYQKFYHWLINDKADELYEEFFKISQ